MEEDLRALLLGAPAITALAGTRINFGRHPQGDPLPALVLTTVSDREGLTLDGPDGLQRARVQIDCYAASYGEAKRLSRAVRDLLHGHAGGGFRALILEAARDLGAPEAPGRPFRVSLDFLVTYSA
ncbi:Protein of unknown function [[Luteovulum] sphaeroides subsp. megalophilum]|uniref:DUF3168 domain-containing protein n=1 Tax=Cereibacter sphaeroides TaxID=1063 RepID=UPI000B6AC2A7|nr:DUF3168 domain-containing protein [Cereibacter sphaeroides]SNT43578.1 Protein of unknown function [[Luteovulum] sphaeroides subsp. megalophilum]